MAETKYNKVCYFCKTNMLTKSNDKKFCSVKCKGKYHWQKTKQNINKNKTKEIKAIKRIAKNKDVNIYTILVLKEIASLLRIKRNNKRKYGSLGTNIKIKCKLCKQYFIYTVKMGRHADYCSECNIVATKQIKKKHSKIHKAKRRAIERGVFADNIDLIKVFETAKWKCHICGCNTPKELRGSYKDNAPELDHIITLAEGGTHAYTNVNCSCRKCNQAKGSRSYGQIKLF
jgi:5-methylcytosine-specific restriction endonuclease McrA